MTKPRVIIGLCGPKGAGKSTLAKILVRSGGEFHIMRFADPLKLMLQALMICQGCPGQRAWLLLNDPDLKDSPCSYLNGHTPRFAMQTLGSEWGRNILGADFWPAIWAKRVSRHETMGVIVDDVRHLNEAEQIRNVGGKIIRIDREGHGPGVHSSEQEYTGIEPDLIIQNTEGGYGEDMTDALREAGLIK